jgi:ankyrin repeat protein
LFYAAANGREANVELLLGAGANVDARDGNGLTPLCVATAFAPGDLKTMQLLLDHEMSPRAAATAALLCLEESRNRETKLRLLIYKGGDPKTLDRNGNPLLIYYAEHDDDFYDVVQGLHEAGNVDLSVRSQAGHTALMVAANRGNEATVNVLLWMGADCLVKADDGRTALDMAREEAQSVLANKDHYRKIIEMLTRCQQQAGSPSETRPPARRP